MSLVNEQKGAKKEVIIETIRKFQDLKTLQFPYLCKELDILLCMIEQESSTVSFKRMCGKYTFQFELSKIDPQNYDYKMSFSLEPTNEPCNIF